MGKAQGRQRQDEGASKGQAERLGQELVKRDHIRFRDGRDDVYAGIPKIFGRLDAGQLACF